MENKNIDLTNASSYEVACAAVKALIKMKGNAIKLFCVKETSSVTDYYITVTGRSKTQVSALADEVVYQLGLSCVSSYKAIAPLIENSVGSRFTYEGVIITPVATADGVDLKFSCGGHTLVVENYTKAEFDRIFGL